MLKKIFLVALVFGSISCNSNKGTQLLAGNINTDDAGGTVPGIICPAGYVFVKSYLNGVSDFCVMQFEAKMSEDNKAVSKPENTPWVNITQIAAKSECTKLGEKYDLISNPEWISLARHLESQDDNWTSGEVGEGLIYRGHSDDTPSVILSVNDPDDFYDQTGNTLVTGKSQRRVLLLESGEEVWDLSGNVLEYVDFTLGGELVSPPTCVGFNWMQFQSLKTNCPNFTPGDVDPVNFKNHNPFNEAYGLGRVHGGNAGGFIRGGSKGFGANATQKINNQILAGIYSFGLDAPANHPGGFGHVGFRCVYRP
jgi:hypothetical protein